MGTLKKFFWVFVFLLVSSLFAQEVQESSSEARGDILAPPTAPPVGEKEVPELSPKKAEEELKSTFVGPQEQEAPLLGIEEIPFWHNTRVSLAPVFSANIPELRKVVPYGYGAILGYEWVPAGRFYPDFKAEFSFVNYGSSPHRVTGGSWALGLHWLYPVKVTKYPMAIQAALLPGTAIYQVEDRIETRTVHKFQGNVVLGYEMELFRQFFVFLQSRYTYIYDPKVPFHSTGFALGVAYHLWAPLRTQKRKPYSDF